MNEENKKAAPTRRSSRKPKKSDAAKSSEESAKRFKQYKEMASSISYAPNSDSDDDGKVNWKTGAAGKSKDGEERAFEEPKAKPKGGRSFKSAEEDDDEYDFDPSEEGGDLDKKPRSTAGGSVNECWLQKVFNNPSYYHQDEHRPTIHPYPQSLQYANVDPSSPRPTRPLVDDGQPIFAQASEVLQYYNKDGELTNVPPDIIVENNDVINVHFARTVVDVMENKYGRNGKRTAKNPQGCFTCSDVEDFLKSADHEIDSDWQDKAGAVPDVNFFRFINDVSKLLTSGSSGGTVHGTDPIVYGTGCNFYSKVAVLISRDYPGYVKCKCLPCIFWYPLPICLLTFFLSRLAPFYFPERARPIQLQW